MIVISEFMNATAVDRLRGEFDVRYEPTLVDELQQLHVAVSSATALIVRNRTQVDPELIARAPKLRVVGRLGVGLDNIDTSACAARSIEVIAATGANAVSVAEYVLTTAMLLLRGAYTSSAAVAAGQWPRPTLSQGREINGKTLGLIGFGSIGRITAQLARCLGMRVIAYDALVAEDDAAWRDHGVERNTLENVLAEADVVSLHVPLDAQTRGLIGASRIAKMKRSAVIINTSRGGIVDEAALADALRAGSLAGAALDVFENEPLAAGSMLANAPNLILTPHIAGVTQESSVRVGELIADRVSASLRTLRPV